MKNLHWGNRASAKPEARATETLNKHMRVAQAIHQRVKHERSLASAAAREAHLRSLMGLSATPARDIDKERGG